MRPHHPWYRAANNSWYVEIDGQQHLLGKHPENTPPPRKRKRGDPPPRPPEAIERGYHKLMAADPKSLPKGDALKVAVVCDLFLDFSQRHHAVDTYRGYRDFLQDFCEMYGTLAASDLKPLHVTRWLDAHPGWKGCRRNAIVAVKRAFNWADVEGLLSPNPIKAVKKPKQKRRDRVLTPAERKELLDAIPDEPFREFVFALFETGARPGEVRKVTAAHVNLQLGIWVFKEHKTAERTGRPRIIYLTPAMVELTRKLVEKYPEGPLFRGPRSKRGFSRNGVRCRFRNLRAKLPRLAGVISYTARHSWATQALVNGVGIAQVAELLGHVDTSTVSEHYAHLAGNVQHLRDMAAKASGGTNHG
jgi:site-specific recombinase XerD